MRIVHADQHPQQGGGRGHQQGQGREPGPGPYEGQTDRQRDGERGVVARE